MPLKDNLFTVLKCNKKMDESLSDIELQTIYKFFNALSERLYNENRLSDVTYAMCRCSGKFAELFFYLFFPDDEYNVNGVWIREYYESGGCRPDFCFIDCDNSKKYIIENKIWDKDTHDEQYYQVFKDCKRGFIANYILRENKYYHSSKTWSELIKCLENYLERGKYDLNLLEEKLLSGYTHYLRKILNLVEVKKMNLRNLSSIRSFFSMVEEIVKKSDDFEVNYSHNLDNCGWNWIGKWYKYEKNETYFYFVIDWGSDSDKETVEVGIWIQNNKAINANNYKLLFDNNLFRTIKKEPLDFDQDWGVSFIMIEELKEKFLDEKTAVEEQKRAFEVFFNEVLTLVQSLKI